MEWAVRCGEVVWRWMDWVGLGWVGLGGVGTIAMVMHYHTDGNALPSVW